MNKLLALPWWLDLLLIGLVVGGLGLVVHSYNRWQQGKGEARVQARWDQEKSARKDVVIQRQTAVAAINNQQAQKAQKVDDETQEQLAAAQLAADRLRASNRSLLGTVDSIRADALSEATSRARLVAQNTALADVFSECSGRRETVAEEADRLAIQVSGLLDLVSEK